MLINTLAAATTAAAPQNKFGFAEALEQGGFIAYATVVILGIMSFGSFYILFTKFFEQQRIYRQVRDVRANFWRAQNLREGANKLDKNSAFRQLVDDGLAAEEQHSKRTDALEAHDWLHGAMARSEATVNARLAGGLPFLATVGATAPFIGLFGTVVGIYRALINIGIAGSASIDKVAGPVGEALIMTALGLLVAVPAVLAYNWLQSRNKRIAEHLHGFSVEVLANITSKGAVRPIIAGPAGKTAATAPGRATTPAGSTPAGTTPQSTQVPPSGMKK
jgi:biopolymer transport protein ExbB